LNRADTACQDIVMLITNTSNGPKVVNTVNGAVVINAGQAVTVDVYAREKTAVETSGWWTVSGNYAPNPIDPQTEKIVAAGGVLQTSVPAPGLIPYNLKPSSLKNWRAALATSFSGGSRAKIAFTGDSTTMGAGAGLPGTTWQTGAFSKSVSAFLADLFDRAGIQTAHDGQVYTNGAPLAGLAGVTDYNPKITFENAGWVLHGRMFQNTSTTDKIAYTPAKSSDSFLVGYHARPSGGGIFGIYDNGALSGAQIDTTNATEAVLTAIRTRAASINPWQVARISGASVGVSFVEAYHSTNTKVSILNGAIFGSNSTTWTESSAPLLRLNMWDAWQPHLIFLNIGINDKNFNVPVETFKSNIRTITAKYKGLNADVVLVRHHPFASAYPNLDGAYAQAFYDLSHELDVPLIDLSVRFTNLASAQGTDYYNDFVHLKAKGYSDIAMSYWQLAQPQ
jgi:lysophospholipase L1-like esterase